MNSQTSEKITARQIFSRVAWFVVCSVIVMGIYILVMFPLAPMISAGVEDSPEMEKTASAIGTAVFFFFTAAYVIPLYIFLFKKDIGLKTEILRVTDSGFDWKTVFRAVYRKIGLLDHIIYAVMSLLVLIGHYIRVPFNYLMIQEAAFYEIPIPKPLAFLCCLLVFAGEYALCLALAAKKWDKNRLHRS